MKNRKKKKKPKNNLIIKRSRLPFFKQEKESGMAYIASVWLSENPVEAWEIREPSDWEDSLVREQLG